MKEFLYFFATGIIAFIVGLFLSDFAPAHLVARELLVPLLLWPILFAVMLYVVRRSFATAIHGLIISLLVSILAYLSSYYFPWLMILLPAILAAVSLKLGFVWRATAVSYTTLILSFLVFFALSITYHPGICYIRIQKLDTSEEFAEVSWNELKDYPVLEKAIVNCKKSDEELCFSKFEISRGEWQNTMNFVELKGRILKIDREYYEIVYMQAIFGD